jgi:hypothetical protein
MPRSRFSFGSRQLGYRSSNLGATFILLVDHQQQTVQSLLTTDREAKKYADGIHYQYASNFFIY